jgi:hypothetical protein
VPYEIEYQVTSESSEQAEASVTYYLNGETIEEAITTPWSETFYSTDHYVAIEAYKTNSADGIDLRVYVTKTADKFTLFRETDESHVKMSDSLW